MSIITDDYIYRRYNIEDDNALKRHLITDDYNKKNYYHWIVTTNKNDIVGIIKVVRYNDYLKTIQIDYELDNNKETILKEIYKFFFNEVGCNRIEVRTNIYDDVPLMKFEGILRDAELIDKHFVDVKLFSIIKSDLCE